MSKWRGEFSCNNHISSENLSHLGTGKQVRIPAVLISAALLLVGLNKASVRDLGKLKDLSVFSSFISEILRLQGKQKKNRLRKLQCVSLCAFFLYYNFIEVHHAVFSMVCSSVIVLYGFITCFLFIHQLRDI